MFSLLNNLKYIFFPNYCGGCDNLLHPNEIGICLKCLHTIPYTDFHNERHNLMTNLFYERLPINHATALCYFSKGNITQTIIHNIKFHKHKELAYIMGEILGQKLSNSDYYRNIDFIIPIPLHYKRENKRGYNQSEMFASGISKIMNVPVANNVLFRNIHNKPQSSTSYASRIKNVEDVFSVSQNVDLTNKKILLVDDVVTTGSTIVSAGNVILQQYNVELLVGGIAIAI